MAETPLGFDLGTVDTTSVALQVPSWHELVVRNEAGDLVVAIGRDGGVRFGDGITPEAAAREFYQAVSRELSNVGRAAPGGAR